MILAELRTFSQAAKMLDLDFSCKHASQRFYASLTTFTLEQKNTNKMFEVPSSKRQLSRFMLYNTFSECPTLKK